jgi:hypothetical protein
VTTLVEPIRVEEGEFLDRDGRRFAVVDNAGNDRFLRPIDHFG